MTNDEMRKAVAEWMGWIRYEKPSQFGPKHPNYICWKRWLKGKDMEVIERLPDFPNDLNAVHEAEKKLDVQQATLYQDILCKIVVTIDKLFPASQAYPMDGFVIHATARQRCEALLRTINKWKE